MVISGIDPHANVRQMKLIFPACFIDAVKVNVATDFSILFIRLNYTSQLG